ncbi:unnamed protein product [Rhizoctonia solani]|uniref:Uncharacterized protein n=1 Tax=Rhizoctonia solani TaxID=456999 RepID=A0A8H3CCZ5_9AGAM|nr:unnamed protein product [Rhizoctonia solani]
MINEAPMSGNMDTLFVRAGRPLRIHFDDTRITAVAIRQLSWRVEQGGGAIVEQPSSADVLVVDPAAPWVFHDFLRIKQPDLRPNVVLAFWISLCLTTRSLIWVKHPYWQQIVVPSERSSHSEIPQGVTAYSSFLAGFTYAKIAPFPSNKIAPRSSIPLERDSSVISNIDNSDLEVSRSLEPGASTDEELLEIVRKPKQAASHEAIPRPGSPSAVASPERPAEVREDEAEVSDILPAAEVSLPPNDVDMSPPEPVQRLAKEPIAENLVPPGDSTPKELAERQPQAIQGPSGTRRRTSPRHSPSQNEQDISVGPADISPASATVAVEPDVELESDSVGPAIGTGPSATPRYTVAKSASPAASEAVTATEEAHAPSNLDSTPPPASEEPRSTPLESSPQVANILTNESLIGTNADLDTHKAPSPRAPSDSDISSATRSESAATSKSPSALNGQPRARDQSPTEAGASSEAVEPTGSTVPPMEISSPVEPTKPLPSTSTNTSAVVPKASKPPFKQSSVSTSSTGLKYVPDPSTGAQSSRPSPSNATKIKIRPKMRPVPQADGNDSVASTSSPRTSLPHLKSKLNIQSGGNGIRVRPRPSVASATGGARVIKKNATPTSAAPAGSPASTISSVTNTTTSLPASASVTPASTITADTPKPAPGSSLSRPKKLIIRSPTISTTSLSRPSASVSPVQSRHPAPASTSRARPSSSETHPLFSPPTPPTPTPEQLASLAAKRPAWTKEEDQYIIDYMNWVFAQDPFASTSEIMRQIAANCQYRPAGNWQNRFKSKEDSIYMNEVPILFERLTNKTSGVSRGRNSSKTLEILSGTRTRNRRTVDYVDSSDDENGGSSNDEDGPPRKRTRRSTAGGRRKSDRLG